MIHVPHVTPNLPNPKLQLGTLCCNLRKPQIDKFRKMAARPAADPVVLRDGRLTARKAGGQAYTLACVIEALLIGRLLRSATSLPQVLYRSVGYVFGADVAQKVKDDIRSGFLITNKNLLCGFCGLCVVGGTVH